MNTEQQQRIEQIRERSQAKYQNTKLGDPLDEPCPGCGCVTFAAARKDVDFLLSIVKEQEADGIPEHIDMEIVETRETPARIVKRWLLEARNGRALESVLLQRDRELLERYIAQVTTSMRSLCVEKAREVLKPYELEFRQKTNSATNIVDYVAMALESLTLQDQELKQS